MVKKVLKHLNPAKTTHRRTPSVWKVPTTATARERA
jgi:hypothetical protein